MRARDAAGNVDPDPPAAAWTVEASAEGGCACGAGPAPLLAMLPVPWLRRRRSSRRFPKS